MFQIQLDPAWRSMLSSLSKDDKCDFYDLLFDLSDYLQVPRSETFVSPLLSNPILKVCYDTILPLVTPRSQSYRLVCDRNKKNVIERHRKERIEMLKPKSERLPVVPVVASGSGGKKDIYNTSISISNNVSISAKILFRKTIVDCIHGVENYQLLFTPSLLDSFYDHRTEPDKKWRMRYELQKTWDIKKRLFTWLENKVTNFWKNNVDFGKRKAEQLAKKKIDDNGMDAYDRAIKQSLTSPTPSHGLNWNNTTSAT